MDSYTKLLLQAKTPLATLKHAEVIKKYYLWLKWAQKNFNTKNTESESCFSTQNILNTDQVLISLSYISRGKIDGGDTSLTVPIPSFPYPAPVVDPNAFGGEQLDVTLYVALNLSRDWRMKFRYKQPTLLDLNGPQSALDRHVSISVSTSF